MITKCETSLTFRHLVKYDPFRNLGGDMRLIVLGLLLVTGHTLAGDILIYHPDPTLTGGLLCNYYDPDFIKIDHHTEERVSICNRRVKRNRKAELLDLYNIPWSKRGEYKIDHIIPLSLGGSNQIENLFPIHLSLCSDYESIESKMLTSFRSGELSHADVVDKVLDWKLKEWRLSNR